MVGNNLQAMHTIIEEPPDQGGGNSATCYATYTNVPWVGEFWRCGDCVRVTGINKSDPGTCNFP